MSMTAAAPHKVAVIVGSLRQGSINEQLARALAKLAAPAMELTIVPIGGLPLYNPDIDGSTPAADAFRAAVGAADAVLFVTPEYNRSIPAPMKNALDWGSRPYSKACLAGKPAASIGASPGAVGTAAAQQQMRAVMTVLDMQVLGQPEVYIQFKGGLVDAEFNITNEGTKAFLTGFLGRFAGWIRQQGLR
ncbi:NAD(P)H-dependent oxidoreductase [Roseomonas sp. ACRSG]|nr:NAD(P)H-dependent oxidoreductase [Roseomonas sp. ACRSG]